MSEFAYIDWLRRLTPPDPRVLLGPGDDTAALRLTPGVPCLVTTDMLLEGSCFLLAEAGPRRVGRKALAVNLSDIAAMAGRPVAAVVSVGLPRRGGRALAEGPYLGLRELADAFGTAAVGGDPSSGGGPPGNTPWATARTSSWFARWRRRTGAGWWKPSPSRA